MADSRKARDAVTEYRLTTALAQVRVRELATDTSLLLWSQHIRERMVERDITDSDVLKVLRTGDVESDPTAGKYAGEWRIKLTRGLANGRVAGVVTVLLIGGKLRLITTEWEDRR